MAQESPKNGAMAVLSTLAQSGDTWVKLGTLGLVALSGLGNWFATEQTGKENRRQTDKEIREVWAALDRNKDEFAQIVRDSAESRRILEDWQRHVPK